MRVVGLVGYVAIFGPAWALPDTHVDHRGLGDVMKMFGVVVLALIAAVVGIVLASRAARRGYDAVTRG